MSSSQSKTLFKKAQSSKKAATGYPSQGARFPKITRLYKVKRPWVARGMSGRNEWGRGAPAVSWSLIEMSWSSSSSSCVRLGQEFAKVARYSVRSCECGQWLRRDHECQRPVSKKEVQKGVGNIYRLRTDVHSSRDKEAAGRMTADTTLQWTTRVDGKRSEATSTEPPPVLSFSHAKSDPQIDAHPLQSALSWAIAMRAKPIRGGRAGSRNTLQP